MRGTRKRGHHPFVGRADELKRCEQLLLGELDALYIYGEPGLGKTRLLGECGKLAENHGIPVVRLNAHRIPRAVVPLAQALSALPRPGAAGTVLLLVDGFEAHACLERHYRDVVLPGLPSGTRLLFAGEHPLTLPWQHGERRIGLCPLKRLSDLDSETYLDSKGVPKDCHSLVVSRAEGSPLFLTTMAEYVLDGQCADTPGSGDHCSLLQLLQYVLREAPSHEHRQALWASAMAEVVSERLLAALLDQPRSNECYRWLSARPFVDQVSGGLMMHKLFREPLWDDLRGQDPTLLNEFLLRSGRFHIGRLEGLREQRARLNCARAHFYAQRLQEPVAGLAQRWVHSGLYRSPARFEQSPQLEELLSRHEGQAAGELCTHWLRSQPEGTHVFRDISGQPAGLLQTLSLGTLDRRDGARDPAVAAAFQVLTDLRASATGRGPGRPSTRRRLGRHVMLVRFWLDAEHYHAESPGRAEVLVQALFQALTAAELSLFLVAVPNRSLSQAAPLLEANLLQHFAAGDFELGGLPYQLLGVDFAKTPSPHWLRNALATLFSGDSRVSSPPLQDWNLGRNEFTQAVQQALCNFKDNQQLTSSPLKSVLGPQTVPEQAAAGLRAWLIAGIQRVARMPGGATYAQQLQETYVDDESSTEQGAADSTTAAAEQLLVATLWDAVMQYQRAKQRAI